MGDNIQRVIVLDGDGRPIDVDAAGQLLVVPAASPDVTILNAWKSVTASGNNQEIIAAPGSGNHIHLTFVCVTTNTATNLWMHFGTDTTNSTVLRFNYLADGGVAASFGAYGPRGDDNESLTINVAATANVQITVHYYLD